MSRLILPLGLLLFLCPAVLAQDKPKVEIFGGYSFSNINFPDDRIKTKGWHAMIAVNSSQSWLEFVADVSGHYGTLGDSSTATHIAMAGMRSSFQRGRVMGFVHSMYGVSFGHPAVIPLEAIDAKQRVWFTFVPGGGGLDIVLNRRIALRVLQFDLIFHSQAPVYLQTFPQTDSSRIQTRVSCGVVLRFGKV